MARAFHDINEKPRICTSQVPQVSIVVQFSRKNTA
jgi:hypothetical protein